jgi:hypothetical protein
MHKHQALLALATLGTVRDAFSRRFASTADRFRARLAARYGQRTSTVKYAEAFEICEYGRQPDEAEIRRLFPFFP